MGTGSVAQSSDSARSTRKRSRDEMLGGKITGSQSKAAVAAQNDQQDDVQPVKVKKPRKAKPKPGEEKRLKRFREKAPHTWCERCVRATLQRMFVIDRNRTEVDGIPQESIDIAGSTGNIYTVTIKHLPSCTCPDGLKRNICKHIIYILRFVLKAPAELEYQAAFLSSELKQIFDASPMPNSELEDDDSNRKPVEGDCPVCFNEFEPYEHVIWCKASCGNNIHKECFEKWAKSHTGMEVRCVYCRATWKGDDASLEVIRAAREGRQVNSEGYVNLGAELNMDTSRDTSTYHSFWVDRQIRSGHTF